MCDTALTTVGELAARAARVSGRLLLCQLTGPDAHAGRVSWHHGGGQVAGAAVVLARMASTWPGDRPAVLPELRSPVMTVGP